MSRQRRTVVALSALALLLASWGTGRTAGAAGDGSWVPRVATFSGPVTTGHIVEPLSGVNVDLRAHGYVEQEFFASGQAYAFTATSTPSSGRWSVEASSPAPYRTRIVVRRPASPSRFNGTVVVEWMNVSGGESAPDWDYLNPMLMRDGYAYVGVSAQALGVEGGQAVLGVTGPTQGLVHQEPSRYGSLDHPGDQYALDMFAQIGKALRTGHTTVFGALRPRHVVAAGESQSAFYLTSFADAVQPSTHAYDGIFIHSRGGGGGGIGGGFGISGDLRIRTDLSVPVFMFETQTDLTTLGYAAAQQPNTARIRTWEVAGTSHADAYLVGNNAQILGCTQPINDGPQHQVVQAAFVAFTNWVVHQVPPPTPPPFRLATRNPATYVLDKYGNVVGGVRTPAVDVPISTLSGSPPPGATVLCALFGSATPLSPAALAARYPTKAAYLAAYTQSLHRAVTAGYILPADRAGLLSQARQAPVP